MSSPNYKKKLIEEYNILKKQLHDLNENFDQSSDQSSDQSGGIIQGRLIKIPQREVAITNDDKNKIKDVTYIIPKNTLLFRAVEDYKDDLFGIKIKEKSCIPFNYNVFFYFDPYTIDLIPKWFSKFKKIDVYATNEDTVVLNLNIRNLNRGTRWSENPVIENCNIPKDICVTGRDYDPCLKKEFIKKNNNIYGYITMGRSDSQMFRENIKKANKEVAQTVHKIKSHKNEIGPAELGLYPLKNRKPEDIYINVKDQDKFLNSNKYVYRHITTLVRNPNIIRNFMQKHAADRKEGYFFIYK